MKTVSLDITAHQSKEDLESFFKEHHLDKGDHLKIFTDEDLKSIGFLGTIVILAYILLREFGKTEDKREGITKNIYDNSNSLDGIRTVLENETGVKVDIEPKPSVSYDPFEATFGIWKDSDITLEKIRKEAWERT